MGRNVVMVRGQAEGCLSEMYIVDLEGAAPARFSGLVATEDAEALRRRAPTAVITPPLAAPFIAAIYAVGELTGRWQAKLEKPSRYRP